MRERKVFEREVKEKKHSIFSIIKEFNVVVPLADLIILSNRIAPRFYTICSSALAKPNNL